MGILAPGKTQQSAAPQRFDGQPVMLQADQFPWQLAAGSPTRLHDIKPSGRGVAAPFAIPFLPW